MKIEGQGLDKELEEMRTEMAKCVGCPSTFTFALLTHPCPSCTSGHHAICHHVPLLKYPCSCILAHVLCSGTKNICGRSLCEDGLRLGAMHTTSHHATTRIHALPASSLCLLPVCIVPALCHRCPCPSLCVSHRYYGCLSPKFSGYSMGTAWVLLCMHDA